MNQREELRATKATTSDLGSWMVYMVDDGEADKKEMWFAAGVECDLVTAAGRPAKFPCSRSGASSRSPSSTRFEYWISSIDRNWQGATITTKLAAGCNLGRIAALQIIG